MEVRWSFHARSFGHGALPLVLLACAYLSSGSVTGTELPGQSRPGFAAIYYDKPYKTGSTSVANFFGGFATANRLPLNALLCHKACPGLKLRDVMASVEPGASRQVFKRHKLWHHEAGNGSAWREQGLYLVTSIRNPVERYMSWQRENVVFPHLPATLDETIIRGNIMAERMHIVHNPYSLHAYYSLGVTEWSEAMEDDIVSRFDCIIELGREGYGLDRLATLLQSAGCKIFNRTVGIHANVRLADTGGATEVIPHFASEKGILGPEFRLYRKLRAASEARGNCHLGNLATLCGRG